MKTTFFSKQFKNLKSFVKNRLDRFEPEVIINTFIIAFFVLIFICASIFLHPDGSHFYYHFVSEHGAVTILSEAFLATAGIMAYLAIFMTPSENKRQRFFFIILAISLTYLAADEVLQFHEHVGDWLDDLRLLKIIFVKTPIRRWNDLIIIIYGILAVPFILSFLPTILKLPYLAEDFVVAFIWFIIHTTIDSVVDEPTAASYIIEESSKLYTSTFINLGLMNVLHFLMKAKYEKTSARGMRILEKPWN
jgi:hypothetical protein